MGYGLYMGHILSLFTYLLTTSVSGRVPGYPSYYPTGTRVINYPDMAALLYPHSNSGLSRNSARKRVIYIFLDMQLCMVWLKFHV